MNVYDRIKDKFKDGTYVDGNRINLDIPYDSKKLLRNIPMKERTPGVCVNALEYCNGTLDEVPVSSRTREFFIHAFTNKSVFDFIQNHLIAFDKEFFKDLIVTNSYSTMFDNTNCFEIMPIEDIDEEMCSIAAIHSRDWSNDGWFESVLRRKPEALNKDLWNFAIRAFPILSTDNDDIILKKVPKEYQDEEFYFNLLTGNVVSRIKLEGNNDNIMNFIPKNIMTQEFLKRVVDEKAFNLCRFNDYGLYMLINYTLNGVEYEEELWKYAIRKYGDAAINNMPLDDEKIDFFLSLYKKTSIEYSGFKKRYKNYKMQKADKKAYEDYKDRIKKETVESATTVLGLSMLSGGLTDEILNYESDIRKLNPMTVLPIEYRGYIPEDYELDYDSEEYLELMYNKLGIKVLGKRNEFYYNVILPDNWTVEIDGSYTCVRNENNEVVILYVSDKKYYDMEVYVYDIKEVKDKTLTL